MASTNYCRIHSFNNTHINTKAPISSLSFPPFFSPNLGPTQLPRFRIRTQGLRFRAPRISCLLADGRDELNQSGPFSFSTNSQQEEAAIDLKLPRRSLLVTFTCDACGARSQKLINRLAYERGLVYVQCSGCCVYHKLVDNLGLVVEYKLQDEVDFDANTDHS